MFMSTDSCWFGISATVLQTNGRHWILGRWPQEPMLSSSRLDNRKEYACSDE
ncbi:unnamed protein product [Fusarium venenatum]|uniref:Uncharacterized protein n=1 Tax=Fusarium venenatum TaxID=56646 RepID=A0A2L2TLI9_9HYPO|nr:uncharacterized protein FVRRES_09130 [Fusarium venenatum]CEI69053.1 unnamed protein product [Fusarium venenatum]